MIYDYENTIDFARMQGEEIGLAKGREEGREEGIYAVARELIAIGMPLEQIVQVTKLTMEQVKSLM